MQNQTKRPKRSRTVPQPLPNELPRQRLLERLAGVQSKVVALLAPAGYGKTTLLAQHARALGTPVAWVTLTEDDAIPAILAATLAKALSEAFPKLNLATWQAAATLGSLPNHLARALAEDLNAAEVSVNLVLDRAERLSSDSGRWLETLIEALDEGHCLWLAGYEGSPLPFARYVADGVATLIPSSELAFTAEETASYLQSRDHAGNAKSIHQSLEGWAVGLALLVAGGSVGLQPQDLVLETLRRLPQAFQAILPEAAVLEIWSEEAAIALGCQLPKGWLRKAVDIGLPLSPLDAKRYRPHTVLMEALETELIQNPERHVALHYAAGAASERFGELLEAIRHFQHAKAFQDACRLAEFLVTEAIDRDELYLVRQILESFTEFDLTTRLKLRLAQAWMNTSESLRGEALVQQIRDQGEHDPLMFSLLAVMAYRRGHFEQQLELVDKGLSCQPEARLRMKILTLKSAALGALGRVNEDLIVSEEAVQAAEESGSKALLATALGTLAVTYGEAGRKVDSEKAFHQSTEWFKRLNFPARVLVNHNNLASLLSDWGRLEESKSLAQRGLVIARQERNHFLAIITATLAIQFLRLGNFSEAIITFQESIRLCPEFGLDGFAYNYHLLQIQAQLLSGDLEAAHQNLNDAQLERPDDALIQLNRLKFTEGLVAFFEGNFATAKEYLSAVGEAFDVYDAPRVTAYLLEIARREGKLTRKMVANLKTQLDNLGHREPLRMDARALQGLFNECVHRGWFPELFEPFTTLDTVTIQQATKPILSIKTFGKVLVEINSQPMKLPFAKTAEMLVWLALHGSATRDEITQAIFGDARASSSLEYFKVAVRKLRAALSEHPEVRFNPLVFENGLYQLHSDLEVRLDAANLHTLEITPLIDQETLEQAVKLYLGDFMPGAKAEWVQSTRAQFHDDILKASMALGHLLEVSNPQEAVRVYQNIIKLEPLHENAYLALIRVLQELGQTNKAREAYSKYAQMLKAEFGRTPKLELQTVFLPSDSQVQARA